MKDISKNYINIQGWMVSYLKLKSNDLLVFALIYGFSQDGESEFKGSISYLCNWLNVSRPTIYKSLDFLVQSGFLEKRTKIENNLTYNRYKVSLQVVKKLYRGGKETLQGGGKETLHHNTNIYNNINNTNNIIDYQNQNLSRLIDIDTFFEEVNIPSQWQDNMFRTYKLNEKTIVLAFNEYRTEQIKNLKNNLRSMSSWATHFNNWVRVRIQKANKD